MGARHPGRQRRSGLRLRHFLYVEVGRGQQGSRPAHPLVDDVAVERALEQDELRPARLRSGGRSWPDLQALPPLLPAADPAVRGRRRSEEHTSELQSLMRISYAVFCLKKKNT